MKKGALLFAKSISYTNKAGNPAVIHVGTVKTETDGIIEIVSSGPFAGSAVFYKSVKAGEEMYPGRIADNDTYVLLGSNTLTNIKESKAVFEELKGFDFE